jgi:hypothetical protein
MMHEFVAAKNAAGWLRVGLLAGWLVAGPH